MPHAHFLEEDKVGMQVGTSSMGNCPLSGSVGTSGFSSALSIIITCGRAKDKFGEEQIIRLKLLFTNICKKIYVRFNFTY